MFSCLNVAALFRLVARSGTAQGGVAWLSVTVRMHLGLGVISKVMCPAWRTHLFSLPIGWQSAAGLSLETSSGHICAATESALSDVPDSFVPFLPLLFCVPEKIKRPVSHNARSRGARKEGLGPWPWQNPRRGPRGAGWWPQHGAMEHWQGQQQQRGARVERGGRAHGGHGGGDCLLP